MMTRDQLADLLRSVNVEALSRESGVAIKTIYRLRHKANAPTLDTVEKLVEAAERLRNASQAAA